jgi:hypothetical protein
MSGWRAGLVALAVGGVILAAGWALNRDRPPDQPGSTTIPEEADVTLACPPAYALVCDQLALRWGTARATYRPGDEPGAGTLIIAPGADLPPGSDPLVFARTPIAIAIWQERAPALERACPIQISCLIDQAGVAWSELGGPAGWGMVTLGLADPAQGIADLEAWRLFVDAGADPDLGTHVRLRAPDEGQLTADLILFPSRADVIVTSEVAIASQLENARQRAGRLSVFYPSPTPFVTVAAEGAGRAAARLAEQLMSEELQALLGSLGLRPLTGEAGELPAELGDPDGEMAPVDPADREALVEAWRVAVGG